jgi:ABC-type Fe3+ transport system substrate-binding protein
MTDLGRRTFIRTSLATAALLSPLGLAACGSSGTSKTQSVSSDAVLTADELESKAKAEGGTLVYYTVSQELLDDQSAAFRKLYPWVNFKAEVNNGSRTITKVIEEARAKAATADVFIGSSATVPSSIRSQVALLMSLPNDSLVPTTYADTTKYGHPTYLQLNPAAYNTNLVKSAPTDIYEYAGPTWKGKLAIDYPQDLGAGYFFLSCRRKAWGEDKWMTWLNGLKANDVFLVDSASSAYQAVLSGERSVAAVSDDDVLSQKAGTPVAASYFDGMPYEVWNMYIAKGAEHPYTAALFINWVMSKAGQENMASSGRSPVLDIDVPIAVSNIVPATTTLATASEINDLINNTEDYLSVYNKLWPLA